MSKQKDHTDLIIELIIKKSTLGLDDNELSVFNAWLNHSEKNQNLYKQLTASDFVQNRTKDLARFNSEKGWTDVYRIIEGKNKPVIRLQPVWYKLSGVAAVLVILIGVFFIIRSNIVSDAEPEYKVAFEDIQPGTNKALLTLSNGSKIELADLDTVLSFNESQIFIDSTTVSYRNSLSINNEIRYNTLTTPRGGTYKIHLSDGTCVWLNAQSELRYPETFSGDNRTVYVKGEVYFEVAKDKSKPFFVFYNNNRIKVLGTAFNVKAYEKSKESLVTLCEGSIQLSSNGQSNILEPNQQAVISEDKTTIISVKAQNFTAWKNNMFLYRSASLGLILDDLSRWYNTEIFYTNPKLKELQFSMYIKRYESIANIINMIETTGEVKFKLDNNNIIVSSK